MKIGFENARINFKILFLKAEMVSEYLIFKSKLFHLKILFLKAEKVSEFLISKSKLFHFKIIFFKDKKVSEILIFRSKLFHSMTVDGKREFLKKFCLQLKSSFIICFASARKYSEEILRRLTFKYFEKIAKFCIPSSFKE